jgi:hypothetical protein
MQPPMMSLDPLPAAAYNNLPPLEAQPPVAREDLLECGQLFETYGLHHHWGIALLHRHAEIDPGQAMLHTRQSSDVDLCHPVSATASLSPAALLLNEDNHFQAYEYDMDTHRSALTAAFLQDFQQLLLARNLQNVLGLTAAPRGGEATIESVIVDDAGMVQGMSSSSCDELQGPLSGSGGIITNWTFGDEPSAEMREVKVCKTLPSGMHQVSEG